MDTQNSLSKGKKYNKKYKLVFDTALSELTHTSEFTYYILYKKFLWFYLPLVTIYRKGIQNSAYISTEFEYRRSMHISNLKEVLHVFDHGRFKPESFSQDRPTWLFNATDNNSLKTEYYDNKEDFLNKKAEFLI